MSSVSSAMRVRAFRRHVLERAHVVQPVGELDQQHAHVVGDGEQKLAQILGLLGLARDEIELLELGQAFDQMADVGAEHLVDLGAGGRRVLDRVVQQRRRDRRVVELQVGQDGRDFERMGEIRIARGALLLAVRLHGVDIGAVEQRLVGVRDCSGGPARSGRTAASSRQAWSFSQSCQWLAERHSSRARAAPGSVTGFCMRGRSVVERAMTRPRPPDAGTV